MALGRFLEDPHMPHTDMLELEKGPNVRGWGNQSPIVKTGQLDNGNAAFDPTIG